MLSHFPSLEAVANASEDGEEDDCANGGADSDDNLLMVFDPGFDLAACAGADALALGGTLEPNNGTVRTL